MKINVVTLLGHKDHGKSTLIGNLLIATKSVSEQRINDAKKTSKKLGRPFEPGFILDSFEEEREGAMTIDTTRAQILYKDNAFELIDVPGHEELIKNMISGASNANFAVLMVSAQKDEGIKDQTFRHLYLARMLGVKKLIVAVNKMDKVKYDKKIFDEIRERISNFLQKIGFSDSEVYFVPISAYNSENLASKSKNMRWYKGKNLLDSMVLQSQEPQSAKAGPLRLSVQGIIEEKGLTMGKIISGEITEGQNIVMLPQDLEYKVSKIFIKGKRSRKAAQGTNVALSLSGEKGIYSRGSVICGLDGMIKPSRKINALVFAVKGPSKSAVLNFNGNPFECKLAIKDVIDTTTGDKISRKLEPLNAANVSIELAKPIVAESFGLSQELGRFVLYQDGEFSGIGIIK